jgi:hypothetical protein
MSTFFLRFAPISFVSMTKFHDIIWIKKHILLKFLAMKMEAVRSSEMSVSVYKST